MTRSHAVLIVAATAVSIACLSVLLRRTPVHMDTPSSPAVASTPAGVGSASPADDQPTKLYAHNLMLRKGPDFRIYVRWISGEMLRTRRLVNPSFDDPESFVLQIQKGVIHVNIGDIGNYLNTASPPGSPLKNISIQPEGDQLKIHGNVHKIISLPIELVGTLSPTPEGLVRFHVNKIDVLKIPLKRLLGGFHIELSDLVHGINVAGVQVVDNDIFFDTQKLLPPPHIRGRLTTLSVRPPDIEVIYGNASNDEASLAQWHNFLRLSGGALDFGKLTMRNADLTMIDASQDPWFDLDLVNYQAQLINGYTRMTAQAGLEIYMPDVDEKAPKKASQSITLQWLQNRNRSLPPDVPVK